MEINNTYNIGQTVYLITDSEQEERVVVAITVTQKKVLHYTLVCGTEESTHCDYEISDSKRVI